MYETFRKRRQNTNMSQKENGGDEMDENNKSDNMGGGNGENEEGEMDDNTGNDDTSQYTGNAPISDNTRGGQTYIAKALKN